MEKINEYEYLAGKGQFDADILEHHEIKYKVHNHGKQINVVSKSGITIAYYPSTGTIVYDSNGKHVLDNQSVFDLINLAKKEEWYGKIQHSKIRNFIC